MNTKEIIDYCTLSPDGDWADACQGHDAAYIDPNATSRLAADNELFRCLWKKNRRVVACVYWLAVRAFGWWYWRRDRAVCPLVDEIKRTFKCIYGLLRGLFKPKETA
jgi:hypothetical protein